MQPKRLGVAVGLAGLVLLGRGAVAYATAQANWNPAFGDPTTTDVSDISGLIAKTVLYTDPMDDVRGSLLLVLRPTGRIDVVATIAVDESLPRAHRPRAPPIA